MFASVFFASDPKGHSHTFRMASDSMGVRPEIEPGSVVPPVVESARLSTSELKIRRFGISKYDVQGQTS